MNPLIQFKTTTLPLLTAFALACFALSPEVRAVTPAPDGGYPGGNTAEGASALFSLTTGGGNTALGFQALYSNAFPIDNTAVGYGALRNNRFGCFNTGTGFDALYNNTTGGGSSSDGFYNVANGFQALFNNTTGFGNTAVGYQAGSNQTVGDRNVYIGYNVLGVAGESNTTRIRNVYASHASVRAVYVNADNKIGTVLSTRRVKDEIKPMDKASEAILALKPVTFRFKQEIDAARAPQFGLIAEEVAQVNPNLVTCDADGKPETVRYDAVNAMLLNEFLKEHRKMQEQEATIAKQQKQIEALTAGLQKVSDQLEMNKPAPQVVNNP
jgi:hypothetical protein